MAGWNQGAALPLVLMVLLDLQRVAGRSPHETQKNITLAVILPQNNTNYPWAWPRVGPALERAVRTVNADASLLPDHVLIYRFNSSEDKGGVCSESLAALMAVDLKLTYDPWAFIGPGCSYTSSPVGLFTTHWDVPMVTAGASAVAFDGGVYPSITNTGPTHKKLGKFALRICEHFGWREHVMLIFSDKKEDDRPCYFAVEGLHAELESINITLEERVFAENKPVNYSQIILDIQNDGRVMFVCCLPDIFRKLMVEFRRADLPHEQYVFFFIDVFAGSLKHGEPWARGDKDDAVARDAFQNVKILTYREPQNPEYREFVNNLKIDAKEMFNYTIEDSLMNIIAGGFYDGLMLYTHALNETMSLSAGRPPGKVVTQRMWNRTFHGVTGIVHLDENGDRETDFALWDMIDTNTSAFQIVLVYNSSEEQLSANPGTTLHWLGGVRPRDVPFCGFKNENPVCVTKTVTIHQMAFIVVFFMFTMILTITFFIYRNSQEKKDPLWCCRKRDSDQGPPPPKPLLPAD